MIAILLFAIAGACKALSDSISHGKVRFTGEWWGVDSWKNKWKNGDKKQGEAFPLSSTVMVWATDGWHAVNFVQYKLIVLAAVLYVPLFNWWIDALILHVAFTVTFEAFYRWVWSKD